MNAIFQASVYVTILPPSFITICTNVRKVFNILLVVSSKFYIWDGMSIIKFLFWNADDSVVKFIVSISGFSLWYRPRYENMLISDNNK